MEVKKTEKIITLTEKEKEKLNEAYLILDELCMNLIRNDIQVITGIMSTEQLYVINHQLLTLTTFSNCLKFI